MLNIMGKFNIAQVYYLFLSLFVLVKQELRTKFCGGHSLQFLLRKHTANIKLQVVVCAAYQFSHKYN